MARADFSSGVSGAITGASTGFQFGGPIGAGIGGAIGGIGGLFGSKKKKKKTISTLDKDQQRLNKIQHQSILGKGPLADLYNYDPEKANAVFEQTRSRPALREFNEKTIPGITGSFRKAGLQNSSYVGDALSKAGRDVQENLDSLRNDYIYKQENQAREAKRSAVDSSLNRQTMGYDTGYSNNRSFDINSIIKSISPSAVDSISKYFKG